MGQKTRREKIIIILSKLRLVAAAKLGVCKVIVLPFQIGISRIFCPLSLSYLKFGKNAPIAFKRACSSRTSILRESV